MKYFYDTEFLEGTQKKRWWNIGKQKPTIDLISIGIVCEDGREYYAVNKDFNLKEAWNRWQQRSGEGDRNNIEPRLYWLRDNVLKSIFIELRAKEVEEYNIAKGINVVLDFPAYHFTYKSIKRLINKYGKSNQQIAEEVYNFCSNDYHKGNNLDYDQRIQYSLYDKFKPQFYGYYSDYDWVVVCWLFGKMNNLPKGFPMFAFDIQQQIEEYKIDKEQLLKEVPQISCHNALQDAIWNKKAYNWIQNEIKDKNNR